MTATHSRARSQPAAATRPRGGSAKRAGDLLEQVEGVLHPGLHARFDDRVPDFLARRLHEDRDQRAAVGLAQSQRVQRAAGLGRRAS